MKKASTPIHVQYGWNHAGVQRIVNQNQHIPVARRIEIFRSLAGYFISKPRIDSREFSASLGELKFAADLLPILERIYGDKTRPPYWILRSWGSGSMGSREMAMHPFRALRESRTSAMKVAKKAAYSMGVDPSDPAALFTLRERIKQAAGRLGLPLQD